MINAHSTRSKHSAWYGCAVVQNRVCSVLVQVPPLTARQGGMSREPRFFTAPTSHALQLDQANSTASLVYAGKLGALH